MGVMATAVDNDNGNNGDENSGDGTRNTDDYIDDGRLWGSN